tara:strand:+ start:47997 stop:48242 length:246 start_codon:yes stop_codon:yes gene_type:complete
MYLNDSEEWLIILIASTIVVGLIVKSYRDYKTMSAEANKKIEQQKKNEAYVRKLKKVIDQKNELLQQAIKLKKDQPKKSKK